MPTKKQSKTGIGRKLWNIVKTEHIVKEASVIALELGSTIRDLAKDSPAANVGHLYDLTERIAKVSGAWNTEKSRRWVKDQLTYNLRDAETRASKGLEQLKASDKQQHEDRYRLVESKLLDVVPMALDATFPTNLVVKNMMSELLQIELPDCDILKLHDLWYSKQEKQRAEVVAFEFRRRKTAPTLAHIHAFLMVKKWSRDGMEHKCLLCWQEMKKNQLQRKGTQHEENLWIKANINNWDGLESFDTGEHGKGIKTLKTFKKGSAVCEYVGKLMNVRKSKKCIENGTSNECYMYFFKYNSQNMCIDATLDDGSFGRLINHSKRKQNVEGKLKLDNKGTPRIIFFAKSDIELGEELYFDYNDSKSAKDIQWLQQ